MTQKTLEIKEGQWFSLGEGAYVFVLEKKFKKLMQAGHAIEAVTNCLQEVEHRDTSNDDDVFNHLTLVESRSMYDALEILGGVVKDEAEAICRRFGLTGY